MHMNVSEERFVEKAFNGFEIEEKIGSGGFATVYKVYKEQINIHRAVKVVKVDNRFGEYENVLEEAKAMMEFENCSGIVRCYDVGEDKEKNIYVGILMELMEGTLKEKIEAKELDDVDIVKIMIGMAGTLQYIHNGKRQHGDIKPSNIFYDKKGNYKLGDFGCSFKVNVDETITINSGSGTIKYWSPERFKTGEKNDTADIYALGLVFAEMLGNDIGNLFSRCTRAEMEEDYKISDPLFREIFFKACDPDTKKRYKNAKEMEVDLQSWLDNHPEECELKEWDGKDLYEKGKTFLQEGNEKAQRYLCAAERKGSKEACYQIALIYDSIQEKKEEATARFEKLVKEEYLPAMNYLAVKSIKDGSNDALKLLENAADKKYPLAMYNKALTLMGGIGTKRNVEEALELMNCAAKQGSKLAISFLEEWNK